MLVPLLKLPPAVYLPGEMLANTIVRWRESQKVALMLNYVDPVLIVCEVE